MSLLRKVSSVGAATLVSRVLGFVRDALMAAVLGAGPLADAFVAAFQLPNLARRLLAEGALNAAFVPAWLTLRAEAGPDAARAFTTRVFGTLAALLLVLAALAALLMPQVIGLIAPGFAPQDARFALAVGWARWTVGYVVLAGLVAVLAGVLNANGRVGAAAALPIAFNRGDDRGPGGGAVRRHGRDPGGGHAAGAGGARGRAGPARHGRPRRRKAARAAARPASGSMPGRT